MITEQCIQRILNNADIVEVINNELALKKTGANYKAKSPFVDENTASFVVSPRKQIFKCFSSGIGGGVVTFLKEHKKLSFVEAMKYLADMQGETLEREDDGLSKEERVTKQQDRKQMAEIMDFAAKQFKKGLADLKEEHPAYQYLFTSRGYTKDELIQWGIGYAPAYSRLIRPNLVDRGLEKLGRKLYLTGEKGDKLNDRIVFPIFDLSDNIIGFAGRAIGDQKPKYLNPGDTPLYHKESVLYGLNFAQREIIRTKNVNLVEGYTDVIAMHKHGITNTVASCGTAITRAQVKLLRRFCNQVTIIFDNDANKENNPGQKAAIRALPVFLREGFLVRTVILPEGQDPDEFFKAGGEASYFADKDQDLITYLIGHLFSKCENAIEKNNLLIEIAEWLNCIDLPLVRADYIKQAATLSNKEFSQKAFKDAFIRLEAKKPKENFADNPLAHLTKAQQDEVHKWGFYQLVTPGNEAKTGFFFRTDSEGHFKKVSNFIIRPLFHKQDEEENTRLVQIDRGFGEPIIREMESDAFMSVDAFRKFCWAQGPYFFDGSKLHLDKIIKRYKDDFPTVFEFKYLGWQEKDKLWAFENYIFNGKLEKYNEMGVVKHGDKHFFSPASSNIYEHLRQDNDMFENDRYLTYKETPLNFSAWADLMHRVYDDHAYAAVNFCFISLFRDIVFKVDNNCPFLYFYGPSQSGKSKCGESVTNLFTHQMPAFNLNSGTDFAFAKRLERFKNVAVMLNEFDDNYIRPDRFQIIKGAYDGEGRERGKGGSKKRTEIQKVNCALILVGQYLSTKDDNSVVSRSIMRTFRKETNRSEAKVRAYNELKEYEKRGISKILTDLLPYRSRLNDDYYLAFNDCYKKILDEGRQDGKAFNERVTRNYAALLAMQICFHSYGITFPWTNDEYFGWLMEEVEIMSSMIQSNDVLTDFWTTVETLFNDAVLREGVHYKLVHRMKARVTVNKKDENIDFDSSKPILYLRMRNVQQLYAKFKRSMGGDALDIISLEAYIKQRDYYLGRVDSEKFGLIGKGGASVSAVLFDYDKLGISLELSEEVPAQIF